jgi:hypothetical protein
MRLPQQPQLALPVTDMPSRAPVLEPGTAVAYMRAGFLIFRRPLDRDILTGHLSVLR